jgi:hypothetical protein
MEVKSVFMATFISVQGSQVANRGDQPLVRDSHYKSRTAVIK